MTENRLIGIAKHVAILNEEVGKIKNDLKWMKRIGYYMATLLTAIAAKSLFF